MNSSSLFRLFFRLFVTTYGCLVLTPLAWSEATRFYTYEGFNSLLDGVAKGTTMGANGFITLAPPQRSLFEEAASRVMAFEGAQDKAAMVLAAATQRFVVIDSAGQKTDYGDVPNGITTAIAYQGGSYFIGTTQPAALYRVTAPGKFEKLATPHNSSGEGAEVKGIWVIKPYRQGLLIATGGAGALYYFEGGRYTELFVSQESLIRSLAVAHDERIYIGGGSKGIVYRMEALPKVMPKTAASPKASQDKSSALSKPSKPLVPVLALLDSELEEITDLLPTPSGELYAIGLATQSGRDERPIEKGKIRAQVLRIDAMGFADGLASSDDEAVYALAQGGNGHLVVATGSIDKENPRGRIYSIDPKSREISLLHQTDAPQIVGLRTLKNGKLLLASSYPATVTLLDSGYATEGEFTLPIFDAGTKTRFGSLQLDAMTPGGTHIAMRIRTGQTGQPDHTWSEWSAPLAVGVGMPQASSGRFAQVKLLLKGDGKQSPRARRVRLSYQRQNVAPYVGDVMVLPKNIALTPILNANDGPKERNISFTEKGFNELRRLEELGSSSEVISKARQSWLPGAVSVAWLAQDSNGDALSYDLHYRREGDERFVLLKERLYTPFYTFDSAILADGRYQFRVIAKDDPANAPHEAKQEKRDSLWFTFDNTPPLLSPLKVDRKAGMVTADAKDALSLIVRAEYSLDGEALRPLASQDGLLDSQFEKLTLKLPTLKEGAHTLTVRVFDEAGNSVSQDVRF